MLIHKSYRYRIYPTVQQAARLDSWSDALRFLWNLAHEQRLLGLARPNGERRYYTAFDQIRELTELRAELPWLADVPYNVCGQLLVNLDHAWQRCFKRLVRRPIWKSKKWDCLGLTEPNKNIWRLDCNGFRFPKVGTLRIVQHRILEGKPKSCTISRDGDQWFASILCELNVSDPKPRTEPAVALDRGVVNIVADSDGNIAPAPRPLKKALKRLAHAQRVVSRRKKGSHRQEKAKLKVARLHRKIRRQRDHVVHVLSAGYAKSHGTVVVEKLNTKGMVRANRGLARGILDASWGKFAECLRYKLAWSGGRLVEVPAAYSSQECSACGCIDAKSRRSQSEYRCIHCGYADHADLNAAKVLLSRMNRAVLRAEGSLNQGSLRNAKAVRLRVTRCTPQSPTHLGGE